MFISVKFYLCALLQGNFVWFLLSKLAVLLSRVPVKDMINLLSMSSYSLINVLN